MENPGEKAASVDGYHRALRFAGRVHAQQRLPGTELPYLVHLAGVAMEVLAAAGGETDDAAPLELHRAVTCAVLHDTVEDTPTTLAELEAEFGREVAQIVAALSKDPALPKAEQMADSLRRIAALPPALRREAAIVKLADRTTNLQAPPAHWTHEKRAAYHAEARLLLAYLEPLAALPAMARRLSARIAAYDTFLTPS